MELAEVGLNIDTAGDVVVCVAHDFGETIVIDVHTVASGGQSIPAAVRPHGALDGLDGRCRPVLRISIFCGLVGGAESRVFSAIIAASRQILLPQQRTSLRTGPLSCLLHGALFFNHRCFAGLFQRCGYLCVGVSGIMDAGKRCLNR